GVSSFEESLLSPDDDEVRLRFCEELSTELSRCIMLFDVLFDGEVPLLWFFSSEDGVSESGEVAVEAEDIVVTGDSRISFEGQSAAASSRALFIRAFGNDNVVSKVGLPPLAVLVGVVLLFLSRLFAVVTSVDEFALLIPGGE